MNNLCLDAPDVAVTEAVGDVFASCAIAPLIIWLIGDLGSGKTTFSRSFIHSLGYGGRVTSPTYTLVEVYDVDAFNVLHLDLYRLDKTRQLLEIGIWEYFDERSICLIEWPENVATGVPDADVKLRFDFFGEGRRIMVEANSGTGVALFEAFEGQWGSNSSIAGV